MTIDILLLGGAPRSGTGLLRRIVGSHPDVTLPTVEVALHRRVATAQPIDDVIDELRPELPGIDLDAVDRSSYATMFDSLMGALRAASGRPIAGDKTPGIELYLDVYRDQFPDHEFGLVQMVRHPFDVAASHIHAYWYERGDDADAVAKIARRWAESAAIATDGVEWLAAHVVVRFEELTVSPRPVASAICDGLDIDPDATAIDAMIEGRDFARFVNSSFDTVGEPVEGVVHEAVRRDGHLTAAQRRIVVDLCGPGAERLGYDLDD